MPIFSTAFSTAMNDWAEYVTDSMQRSILFWDVLRKRGNIMIEHYEQGKPTSFHTNSVDLVEGCSRDNKVPQAL